MESTERKLGPYTLVSKIGRGAFGVVWLAEKRSAIATTRFALKLPRDEDIDLDAFKQEAAIWLQASGHPNVVPMIEADIFDDQVVIVSEYVTGGSLGDWLKQHGGRAATMEAASELIDGVLAGLEHLHSRSIIHRDLKPDNILLQGDTPRLADFGIARLLRTDSHSANISGTLAYMAPETFDGKRNEQTDIWSAGVIYYQMLAGRLPYDQAETAAFIGAIMRHDPPDLPGDVPEVLRHIVMKALKRDPAERYANAEALRRELREAERMLWLDERDAGKAQPVVANHTADTLVLTPARTEPEIETSVVDQPPTILVAAPAPTIANYFHPPHVSDDQIATSPPAAILRPLTETSPGLRSRKLFWLATFGGLLQTAFLLTAVILVWLTWDSSIRTFKGHKSRVESVAFSPDGQTVASGGVDKMLRLWNTENGALRNTLLVDDNAVRAVAFSPDGILVAGMGSDQTTAIKLWDANTGELKFTLNGSSSAHQIAFTPDGSLVAGALYVNQVKLWDTQTGEVKQSLTSTISSYQSLAISPDGKWLAGGSSKIELWDLKTGTLKLTLDGNGIDVASLAFTPDSALLASGGYDGTVKIWNVETGNLVRTFTQDTGNNIASIAISPNGKLLAAAAGVRIMVWEMSGTLKQTFYGHRFQVTSVAFAPDGKTLASGSDDSTVKLWRVP